MKSIPVILVTLFLIFTSISSVTAEEAPTQTIPVENAKAFNIERMLIAGSITDREPVGIVNVFSSATEKVYCFLEATNISEDTTVNFVWYYEEQEMGRVELPISQGARWRTYSSKKLAGLKGTWQVVLQNADGAIMRTVEFSVE